MKKERVPFYWLIPVMIVLATSLACGGTANTGVKVGEVEETEASAPAESNAEPTQAPEAAQPTEASVPEATAAPQNMIYKVGDVVEVDEHLIALYGAEYKGDMLIAKFIIGNPGSTEVSISSFLSFSAKNSDGTRLEMAIFDCEGSLDGSIPPGDKLKGQMCWTGAQPGAKVYYEANLFSSGAIVWEIPESVADQEIEFSGLTDLEITQKIYKVGELIDANGHYIVMTGAEYKGSLLIASFLVGNNGDSDETISSMAGFSARKASGEALEQEYFECEPGLDGSVVPGDILKGKICWNGAEPGSKIYYDASLFSSGMFVWEITESIPPTDLDFPEISSLSIKQATFKVGDVVEVRTHKITLNTLSLNGGTLKANFTIENNGAEDVNVSSMLSFSARNTDGTPLDQNIFDCGTSLDGSVIPGDKLKGDICWDGALPGARIYYDASLFSSGMIIWVLE